MGRLGDQPDPYVMERIFSPDRRLALDYLPYPDPRTQYELEAPEAVALRDAETGATLAEFGGWSMVSGYEWPKAGGVELALLRGVRLRVAPDLTTFTIGDPPVSRPIETLPDWLRSLTAPPTPFLPASPTPSPPARFATISALLIALAVGGYAIYQLPALFRDDTPARPAGGIDAWIVTCPGIGLTAMHLTRDGRLEVPRSIAPNLLPPMEGAEGEARRFGDSRIMVEVEGTAATLWPRGPDRRSIRCRSLADERR